MFTDRGASRNRGDHRDPLPLRNVLLSSSPASSKCRRLSVWRLAVARRRSSRRYQL